MGWKSLWFEEALRSARVLTIDGHAVKVVAPPFFVALKLEAFEDRGKGDFICSTDFEDVICLFNGRKTLVDEIMNEPVVCQGLAEKFAGYLESQDLEDAVTGFVQTESDPEERFGAIMESFRRLARCRACRG